MNYYEHHIGDYLKDTAHLSLLEHGVYSRLLALYYTREGPIPAAQAARLVGARTDEERGALNSVLAEFFEIDGDEWRQARCDVEIAKYLTKQKKAKASADARWSHSERNADAMRTHSERNAKAMLPSPHSPVSIPKKEKAPPAQRAIALPDWLPAKEWEEFILHRKAMRGVPFTDAARAGVLRDLDKVRAKGHDPAEMLSRAITQGWRTVYEPKANPADVARVTVAPIASGRPSGWLEEQAAHRKQVEEERQARLAKKAVA